MRRGLVRVAGAAAATVPAPLLGVLALVVPGRPAKVACVAAAVAWSVGACAATLGPRDRLRAGAAAGLALTAACALTALAWPDVTAVHALLAPQVVAAAFGVAGPADAARRLAVGAVASLVGCVAGYFTGLASVALMYLLGVSEESVGIPFLAVALSVAHLVAVTASGAVALRRAGRLALAAP